MTEEKKYFFEDLKYDSSKIAFLGGGMTAILGGLALGGNVVLTSIEAVKGMPLRDNFVNASQALGFIAGGLAISRYGSQALDNFLSRKLDKTE